MNQSIFQNSKNSHASVVKFKKNKNKNAIYVADEIMKVKFDWPQCQFWSTQIERSWLHIESIYCSKKHFIMNFKMLKTSTMLVLFMNNWILNVDKMRESVFCVMCLFLVPVFECLDVRYWYGHFQFNPRTKKSWLCEFLNVCFMQ